MAREQAVKLPRRPIDFVLEQIARLKAGRIALGALTLAIREGPRHKAQEAAERAAETTEERRLAEARQGEIERIRGRQKQIDWMRALPPARLAEMLDALNPKDRDAADMHDVNKAMVLWGKYGG